MKKIKEIVSLIIIIPIVALTYGIINNNSFLNYISLITITLNSLIISFINWKEKEELEDNLFDLETEYLEVKELLSNALNKLDKETKSRVLAEKQWFESEETMKYLKESNIILRKELDEKDNKPKTIKRPAKPKVKKNETNNK